MLPKKSVLFLLLALFLALSLVACGGADEPEAATDTPAEPAADSGEADEPAEEPAEEPADAGPVELVYWSMWNEDEPQGQVVKSAIESFEAANPDVTVNVVWNGREVRNLLIPALEAGESIDLVDNDTGFIAANFADYALPLDDYLDEPAIDFDGSVRDSLIEALVSQYTVDGRVVSVPYNPFAVMFMYNKDHFAAAGIDATPTTWDEFLEVNQALLDAGFAPITTDVDSYIDIIIGYYAQRAVGCESFMDAMVDPTGEAWNDPAYLQMAQDIRGLWDAGYVAPGTEGNLYPAGQQMVALGEVTMYLNGTWLPTEVQETSGPDFPWGAFSFPSVAGGVGSVNDIMMGSQGIMVVNQSEHPDEAFELIKHIVSEKAQTAMVNDANVPAAHVNVAWSGALAEAGQAVQQSEAAFGWACDLWDAGEVVSNVVLPTFTDLFIGKLSPEEYIDSMVTDSASFWAGQEVAPEEETETEEETAVAGAEITDEEIELTYWSMWNEDEPQGQVIKDAIESFEAAYPNITVNVVWNGREVRNLLIPALEAGESIDVVDNDTGFIANNFADYALPLDDYLNQPAIGFDGSVYDSLIEALLTQYTVDGNIVSVPYNPFAVMFMYNKDHFDAAGITETPETWDEFLAANQALVDAGYTPITTDVDSYIDIIIGYYAQRAVGCDALMTAMTDKSGEAWNDPAYLQMAQDIRGLWDAGYIAPGTEGNLYPLGQQMVALGEVTMYLNGTWLPTEVQETSGPDFPWGAFSFPSVNGGVGSVNDIMMGSQGLMIINSSEHPNEAFELIKYMVSEEAQAAMVNEANVPAAHVNVEWSGALAEAGRAVQNSEAAFGWACDLWNAGEVVSNVVLPTFTDLYIGKLTPEEYIDKMVQDSADFWAGQG